jgi:hypothetical protein
VGRKSADTLMRSGWTGGFQILKPSDTNLPLTQWQRWGSSTFRSVDHVDPCSEMIFKWFTNCNDYISIETALTFPSFPCRLEALQRWTAVAVYHCGRSQLGSQNTEMRRKHKKTRSAEIWDLLRFAEILLADLKYHQ